MTEEERRVVKAQVALDKEEKRKIHEQEAAYHRMFDLEMAAAKKRNNAVLASLDPEHYGPNGRRKVRKAPIKNKEATPLEHMKMSDAVECLINAVRSYGLPSTFGNPPHISFSSIDARAFTKLAKKLADAIAPPEEASE